MRDRSLSTKENISRNLSMSSMKSSIVYHERMECNNAIAIDKEIDDISPALFYEEEQEKALRVSKVAKQQDNMRFKGGNLNTSKLTSQYVLNEEQHSYPTCGSTTYIEDNNIINIQLLYDPQAPTVPELWNGNFHSISLHGSIEHIASDAKNIKNTLNFMARYISNKQVKFSKSNDLEDFNGIGEAIWNFISLVYSANWDSLHADKQSNTLRRKIVAKFTLKIQLAPGKNSKEINRPNLANIERIPPPIPAKSQKKVNVILKYFKNNKPATNSKQFPKSYIQALKQNISISEVIKIKEAFPFIGAKKIDQINNIIKDTPKTKHCIQMTMKSPSRKHVIIPMGNDNNARFMKNPSAHITNINRALRNVKSEVLVDFIHSDLLGTIVITNKVFLQSDL